MEEKISVLIAPHPDDEIIGLYTILKNTENKIIIVYDGETENNRRNEALKVKEEIPNIIGQMFQNSIPMSLINKNNIFYAPDPFFEIHPKHRQWGFIGEQISRQGFDVVFYNTLMNAPYIHEVEDKEEKEKLLNKVYPSQKSLWEYEKKYIIFEGFCKWIF